MAPGGRTRLGEIARLKEDLGYDEEIKDLKDTVTHLCGRMLNLEMEINNLKKLLTRKIE